MSQPPPCPPPPSEPERPALTPEVVSDDESLAEAVDAFIHADKMAGERLHDVVDRQELLRQIVDADTWRLALRLDEMIVERWSDVVVNVARWAFNEGVRTAGQRPAGA